MLWASTSCLHRHYTLHSYKWYNGDKHAHEHRAKCVTTRLFRISFLKRTPNYSSLVFVLSCFFFIAFVGCLTCHPVVTCVSDKRAMTNSGDGVAQMVEKWFCTIFLGVVIEIFKAMNEIYEYIDVIWATIRELMASPISSFFFRLNLTVIYFSIILFGYLWPGPPTTATTPDNRVGFLIFDEKETIFCSIYSNNWIIHVLSRIVHVYIFSCG